METGAQLQDPLVKELPSGSFRKFCIVAPGSEKVAVVSGDEWDFLKKAGNIFQGTVEIDSGNVSLLAKYPGKKDFEVLLEFEGTGPIRRKPGPVKFGKFLESGGELFSPPKKGLDASAKQFFHMRLPGAKKAAVVIDDEWNFLDKEGDIFKGEVDIGKGKITVVGAYSDSKRYDGLLEYFGE